MKKFIKVFFIVLLILVLSALIGLGFYISSVYVSAKSINIDQEAMTTPVQNIQVYDNENRLIKEDNSLSKSYAKVNTLSQDTINAFISIEDKEFYNHKGINYKRVAKAMLNNIKSGKLKEGASTITQQLVKNTLLTSEKTFDRKIKEMALAQKIESMLTKEQILELYLNAIYFGNNCYGIESASNYYFSKPAKELEVQEAAMLAGMIKSPAQYSPIKNPSQCLKRRNLVLSEMEKDGLITSEKYNYLTSKKLELNLNDQKKNRLNSYSQASIDEAEDILGIPAQQIALQGYKIYTYQNEEKQMALENAISGQNLTCDSAGIVINNANHSVEAYVGDSIFKVLDAKRSPGSCIKPILVYSPALNEDIIYPCTQLLDEKTVISDYAPKNVGGTYHGYVSAREALAKSINIPAVKVLSYVGIDKAKAYASDMGIEFDEQDNSYTLALGGMTYGVNILQLAGAYSTFANLGVYAQPKFVSFITDKNDKLVYINNSDEKQVLREDCAYMITDMLVSSTKNGTAKRLSSLNKQIASKTGTVGKSGSKENLDAWNVSYTQDTTCAVWLGNLDNTSISYAGGNQPTEIVKSFFIQIDDDSTFEIPSSIVEKEIDVTELNENHRIVLANGYIPERYTQKEIFSRFNLPKDVSTKFTDIDKPTFKSIVEGNKAYINFEAKDYLTYTFSTDGKVVKQVSDKSGAQEIIIELNGQKQTLEVEYFYTLSPEIKNKQEIKFIKTKKTSKNDKWFI